MKSKIIALVMTLAIILSISSSFAYVGENSEDAVYADITLESGEVISVPTSVYERTVSISADDAAAIAEQFVDDAIEFG